MQGTLLVVGSVNADIYLEIDRLPKPGELIEGGGGYVLPGGKGANQAVAAANLTQNKVAFAGSFGNDSHATMLRRRMEQARVDIDLSLTADCPNGQAVIMLQRGGENSIMLVHAANFAWPTTLPQALVTAVQQAKAVVLQREIPTKTNVEIARFASDAGVPVIMDAGGSSDPVDKALLPYLHLFSPNESELSGATGLPTETEEEIMKAAKKLQDYGVKNVLVTLGGQGSLYLAADGTVTRQACIRAKEVVDTTGAGDCFRGAFVVRLSEGASVQESLRFAAAAAAICVTRKGAMDGMPSREEVDRSLNELDRSLNATCKL